MQVWEGGGQGGGRPASGLQSGGRHDGPTFEKSGDSAPLRINPRSRSNRPADTPGWGAAEAGTTPFFDRRSPRGGRLAGPGRAVLLLVEGAEGDLGAALLELGR